MHWLGLLIIGGCVAPTADGPAPRVDGVARSVPVYGGTMAAHPSGLLVVADPLRDVVVFDADQTRTVLVGRGAEPFRIAITDDRVFVTLRGRGELVTFDHQGEELARVAVCDEPRGVAAEGGTQLVACAGGELVVLQNDAVQAVHHFGPDLRDIVLDGELVYVSRFRDASVLRIERSTMALRNVVRPGHRVATAQIAWRMVPHPWGGALLLHQLHSTEPIELPGADPSPDDEPAYGGTRCVEKEGDPDAPGTTKLVTSHLTRIRDRFPPRTGGILQRVAVAVDVSVEPDGRTYHVASLSDRHGASAVASWEADLAGFSSCPEPLQRTIGAAGMVASIARVDGQVAHYDRASGQLHRGRVVREIGEPDDEAPGARLFHEDSGIGLACASCHPEGQDDGHTWDFGTIGLRRTQNLSGGLTTRGVFHWDADLHSMRALVDDTFTDRMGGREVTDDEVDTLGAWLDGIEPVRPATTEPAAVIARGEALFARPEVGCTACHSGPALSDHASHAVRTDGPLRKTPSLLGVGTRAPWMSDGCAPTLLDRFVDPTCGGDQHGSLDGLSDADLSALAAFVATL